MSRSNAERSHPWGGHQQQRTLQVQAVTEQWGWGGKGLNNGTGIGVAGMGLKGYWEIPPESVNDRGAQGVNRKGVTNGNVPPYNPNKPGNGGEEPQPVGNVRKGTSGKRNSVTTTKRVQTCVWLGQRPYNG